MPNEANTCRKFVLPKLYAAGWSDDQIAEQRTFTAGRIIVQGERAMRRQGKRADFLLRYTRDLLPAVVEAKATDKPVVGFHIRWKLWSSRWNRNAGQTGSDQCKPRILYLADRNVLVDDPKDKTFAPFGDARWRIENGWRC